MSAPKDLCPACQQDPVGTLKQLFVDELQVSRIRGGQNPALRPVFSKVQGVAHGYFEPFPDLDASLKIGVFAHKKLTAWVRFSTDEQPDDTDLNKTCGIGIKLFGVPGPKLLEPGDTHDLLLQNHDVFFAPNATEMCEFTRQTLEGDGGAAYLHAHPVTRRILQEMKKPVPSVLAATYWSVLPYAFADRVVKYKLVPALDCHTVPPAHSDNYLRTDLAARLRESDASFDFYVQFQIDPVHQPIEDATVRWEETATKPVKVGRLTLPRQDVAALGQANYGENLAFNPWHALKEHSPLGSISDARRVAYAASAKVRRAANGIPQSEPGDPRPAEAIPHLSSTEIVSAAIYPPIGVARVGDSAAEYFLGPEVNEPAPQPPGFYRDSQGALKRQAARFRIYGFNREGEAVAELNASNAEIRWSVHLANKKAAWFQFQLALDIPEASSAPPTLLRNVGVADRSTLAITPRLRHIAGCNTSGKDHTFEDGKFMDIKTPVYLGELRTDEQGRLIVLGGHGVSASAHGKHAKAYTFANNEGWHDDVSDGPVTAELTYQGQKLSVDPAWVVVAPPNYAPNRKSVRTMWDLMRDTAINANLMPAPVRPSFNSDIRPIFERLSGLQWVNASFAASFGWKGNNDFSSPSMLARLSRRDPNDSEFRLTLANHFRNFDRDSTSPLPWPWLFGDAANEPPTSPRSYLVLTQTQLHLLQQWAAGDFDADYNPASSPAEKIDSLPLAQQPAMLTRAAMEFCLADAFHPGCEMTWPMRRPSMYMAPFRVKHAGNNVLEPAYSEPLTSETVSYGNTGPCGPQFPGGLTRWLAVPWQTDTASCGSGYGNYDPYLPAFWPARVPNQVLTKENYDRVMDKKRPMDERLSAFAHRSDWMRVLPSRYLDAINAMIHEFGDLGVVEQNPGPGDPEFPAVIEVESPAGLAAHRHYSRAERLAEQKLIEKLHRFTARPPRP